MSKKSRKRNKKILAALALAGGAAMLAKGKLGKASVANTAANEDANIGVTHDALKSSMPSNLSRDTGASTFTPRRKVWSGDQRMIDNNPMIDAVATPIRKKQPLNIYTGAGNMRGMRGGGIAKRGTGAAYKSGGRVKSMGIAKRGGGAAKR
jgi:hypothetical protein